MSPFSAAFLAVVALALVAGSTAISFTDCSGGSVVRVNIPQCPSEPCVLVHGKSIQIQAVFKSMHDGSRVGTTITGNVQGRELALPDDNTDICASGRVRPSCPIRKGSVYTYTTNFHIQKAIPAKPIIVTYKGINEKGQVLACVKINVIVKKN